MRSTGLHYYILVGEFGANGAFKSSIIVIVYFYWKVGSGPLDRYTAVEMAMKNITWTASSLVK